MNDFEKSLRPGLVPVGARLVSLFVTVKYTGGRLSITGVEGPRRNGDCAGSCGQVTDSLAAVVEYAPGWDRAMALRLATIWNDWHLNDMKAGSPAQEAFLKANPVSYVYPESHYEKACEALAAAGLHPDADGYRYGSAWKRVEVPADVLEWLAALPDADRANPWGE